MGNELWNKEEKELLESTKHLWDNELIPPYKVAEDLRKKGATEPFVKKLILGLGFLRGKKFTIEVSKSLRRLKLKVSGWEETLLNTPLPRTRVEYDESEIYRDDIYTTLVEHGFGEKVSQEISDSEIVEV